eukprot:1578652-Rhodomonas_salina.2
MRYVVGASWQFAPRVASSTNFVTVPRKQEGDLTVRKNTPSQRLQIERQTWEPTTLLVVVRVPASAAYPGTGYPRVQLYPRADTAGPGYPGTP